MDDLDRSLPTHHECRSKRLMAAADRIDCFPESSFVELPHLSRRKRHVVRRALGCQLIHQPHTLLRIGKGERLVSWHRCDRRHPRSLLLTLTQPGHFFGQRRDRRSFKQRGERNFNFEEFADSGDELSRQQRMASMLKEVIMDAGLRDLQQRLPQFHQGLFNRVSWDNPRRGVIGCVFRSGKRASIHLARRTERHRVEPQYDGGHHIVR